MKKLKAIKIAGFLFGALFLSYWIGKLGPMEILNRILDLKWWALVLIANSCGWVLVYTAAWRTYFSNL